MGAAALVAGLTFLLWHFGSFWPGVPPASEGLFTLRQVWGAAELLFPNLAAKLLAYH